MPKSPADLSERIVAEFREMPGTALTVAQASRLWAVDDTEAARELRRLERDGILKQSAHGVYVLRSDG